MHKEDGEVALTVCLNPSIKHHVLVIRTFVMIPQRRVVPGEMCCCAVQS